MASRTQANILVYTSSCTLKLVSVNLEILIRTQNLGWGASMKSTWVGYSRSYWPRKNGSHSHDRLTLSTPSVCSLCRNCAVLNHLHWLHHCTESNDVSLLSVYRVFNSLISSYKLNDEPRFYLDHNFNNYEWAKRTKFLLAVIYGSACRH